MEPRAGLEPATYRLRISLLFPATHKVLLSGIAKFIGLEKMLILIVQVEVEKMPVVNEPEKADTSDGE